MVKKNAAKQKAKTPAKTKKWGKKKVKKKRKLGGWWLIANVVSFGIVIGTAVVIFFGDKQDRTPVPIEEPVVATRDVTIYFGSADGETLRGVDYSVKEDSLANEISGSIEILLRGPDKKNRKAERTLPLGTRLLGVRVKGYTAIVNLSREVIDGHTGGTAAEMQTIYSIVNTVALGWPEVRDVQILVEGERTDTIAGHIDIMAPIQPNRTVNAD